MTLSQRIASMTGPDGAVDAEVAVALGWRLHTFNCLNINGSTEQGEMWIRPSYTDEDVEHAVAEYRALVAVNAWPDQSDPPRFTADLNAVRSVVPEGWGWSVSNTGHARCLHPERSPLDCEAKAAGPILALLSAALAARGL